MRLLKCRDDQLDPLGCWPLVKGIRERIAGMGRDPRRWHTAQQQSAWEEGWDLADELLWLRAGGDR